MTSSHPIVNLGWKIKVRTSDVLSRYYKKNGKRIIKDVILGAISIVAFILIWQYASMSINEPYLPTPGLVYATFINAFTVKDSLMGVTMWQNIFFEHEPVPMRFLASYRHRDPSWSVDRFIKEHRSYGQTIVGDIQTDPTYSVGAVILYSIRLDMGTCPHSIPGRALPRII